MEDVAACQLGDFPRAHLLLTDQTFLLFSRLWITFCAIASATSLLVCSLVLPMTGGFLIRRGLAEGLEALGSCVLGTLRLLCGEVDERGLLRARSGDNISHFGMDSGLGNAGVAEVHRQADAAAAAVTVSAARSALQLCGKNTEGLGCIGGEEKRGCGPRNGRLDARLEAA